MSAIASEATFRIAYDGEALDSGSMDVRDLAPALLALSDLFDETNKVLSGPNPDRAVQLRIRHDIRRGSFDVTIQVVQTWLSKIVTMFAGDGASSAANLIEILGFVTGAGIGLFKLIKWLRGRTVKRVELLEEGGARVVVEGDEIIISRPLAKVFNDVGVRRALVAVMAPLNRDGIDSFEVRAPDGKPIERVAKPELPAFTPPPPVDAAPKQIINNEFQKVYTIVSVTFRDGNKWRVSDGQSTIAVTMEDAEFLHRVNRHDVHFAKDDVITCEVRQEQSIGSEGLKTDFFIKRVLDHRHTYRQVLLPFEPAPPAPVLQPVADPEKAPGGATTVTLQPVAAPKEAETDKPAGPTSLPVKAKGAQPKAGQKSTRRKRAAKQDA